MGLFGNSDDLERRVARLEAQVAALMPLLDAAASPTWQQQNNDPVLGAVPAFDADIAREMAAGKKIEAIVIARKKYSLGLAEAKNYVERMSDLR